MFDRFHRKVLEVCQCFAPKRVQKRNHAQIPRDRKIMMRKRAKLRKRLESNYGPARLMGIERDLRELEIKIAESHETEMATEERDAISAIKENTKYFFKFASTKCKIKSGIGPLRNGEELIGDPQQMSELLRAHYETVFVTPITPVSQTDTNMFNGELFEEFDFELFDFIKAAESVRSNSAPGPNGMPAILIKKAIGPLAVPLTLIWRKSMSSGTIPPRLKLGIVTPIHKSGNRGLVNNYRPVTLTSHCIKLFERVLAKNITQYLEGNNLFNDGQHGFRSGKSCLFQLLSHHMYILENMSEGKDVDVVYLDFAKAFDRVDHGVLEQKMKRVGISGAVLGWIMEFLRDRKQRVAVDGAMSGESVVVSGVPQGSVLGPLLFLIHLTDLDEDLQHSRLTSFADDSRVLRPIKGEGNCRLLQEDPWICQRSLLW